MNDNSYGEQPLMSFVISFSIVGNDEWALTVTPVDADGAKPSIILPDCQSMLDFMHEQLAEKSAIPLLLQRSVS